MYDNAACEKVCTDDTAEKCMHCKTSSGKDCLNSCESQQTHFMNLNAMDWEGWYEEHRETQYAWGIRISKGKNGGFHDHAQILEKYLGLGVVFHNTRVSSSGKENWPMDANYEWHDDNGLETKLCYLTLPDHDEARHSYDATDMEADSGYINVSAARAIAVPNASPTDIAKIQVRFQRALRILDLRPYIHPAMLVGSKAAKNGKEVTSRIGTPSGSSHYDAKLNWPRMMVLIESDVSM
ncbi:hypothetical protein LTR49_006995 [Elasticomyces elasticus]|nr:hypothetical protein LTR49_006995 [Elasticomyces elasticus]